MVTDGVVEAYGQEGNGEREFADFLAGLDVLNPQVLADKVLKKACELSLDSPLDDMTVLVGKVWRKTA
jgi:stage II sporulation protein E